VAGDGGNATFQVVSSETTEELFGDQASCGALAEPSGGVKGSDGTVEGLAYTTPVATADFDLDGDTDLVTLGVVRDEQTFQLTSQRLMLGRNDGNGTLGPSSFVVSELALSEQLVTALAVIQLDLDPELEIVLSTLGSNASSIGAGAIYVVHLDASGTPGPLEVLVDRPAIGMTVGDFDGNGIQDFAFGGIDGVSLGLGRPVLP
jgi:hypothetical protein